MKYWVIDKNVEPFGITGPVDLDHVQANVTNCDFGLVVIKDEIDIKAQFEPGQKEDLLFQLKGSHRETMDICRDIFRLLPGADIPRPSQREARPGAPTADLDALYQGAAEALFVTSDELRDRYAHLNPGLQAMNLRNRIRSAGGEI